MAIKIIFGPGGSGKSFFQMHVITKQLRETRRNICTNLAINVPEYNAYLERNFPNEDLNLVGRLRILTDAETFEFWKYRGPLHWTGNEYDYKEDKGANGVCYVIDEAGVSGFSATGWAQKQGQGTRGERCLWYLDQQRKYGDDVFASTNGRTPEQIAKPFRDKAHGFIKLKNGYLQKFGPFKGRGRFEWSEFLEEPRKASEAVAKGTFTLGELSDCYRTQDGVGVIGNGADKGARAKGIPVMWIIPGALVLASLCVLIPYGLGKGASAYIAGDKKPVSSNSSSGKDAGNGAVADAVNGFMGPKLHAAAPDERGIPPATLEPIYGHVTAEAPVWVAGWVVKGSRINVQLSDGRILTEEDGELAIVQRSGVTLKDGNRLYLLSRRPVTRDQSAEEVKPMAYRPPQTVLLNDGTPSPYYGGSVPVAPVASATSP
jgi:hypothetical protein